MPVLIGLVHAFRSRSAEQLSAVDELIEVVPAV
jgi:hypothetical protein